MKKKIPYLHLFREEYRAFKSLERLPKRVLQQMGYLAGLKMSYYNKNKKLLVKGIFIALGGHTPVNFDKW